MKRWCRAKDYRGTDITLEEASKESEEKKEKKITAGFKSSAKLS